VAVSCFTDLLATLQRLPEGTLLPVAGVVQMLQECEEPGEWPQLESPTSVSERWPERVWTVPSQTQLNADECAEAIGRTKAALYQLTRTKRIPHGKRDGALVFKAGEVRAWLIDETETVTPPRKSFAERMAMDNGGEVEHDAISFRIEHARRGRL